MDAPSGPDHGREGSNGNALQPRVVILDAGERPRVEIMELPKSANLGFRFCHHGTSWRVTGRRTADRVLIATPSDPGAPHGTP